jgi:hypothetical protein
MATDELDPKREWREVKVRPLQGNTPRDRPVSRGIFASLGEFATMPFPPPRSCKELTMVRRLVCVFKAWRNLSGPMWFQNRKQTRGGTEPPPVGQPRAQVEERAGRTTLHLIVRR